MMKKAFFLLLLVLLFIVFGTIKIIVNKIFRIKKRKYLLAEGDAK